MFGGDVGVFITGILLGMLQYFRNQAFLEAILDLKFYIRYIADRIINPLHQ